MVPIDTFGFGGIAQRNRARRLGFGFAAPPVSSKGTNYGMAAALDIGDTGPPPATGVTPGTAYGNQPYAGYTGGQDQVIVNGGGYTGRIPVPSNYQPGPWIEPSGGYPNLSNYPPVTVGGGYPALGGSSAGDWIQSAMGGTSSSGYPIPGAGSSPAGDWKQNASGGRSGGSSGTNFNPAARAAADAQANLSFFLPGFVGSLGGFNTQPGGTPRGWLI